MRKYPLVRIPKKVDQTLFLLCEELKSSKFFNGMAKVGIDDVYFQPHLMSVILDRMGFQYIPDDLVAKYTDLLSNYSKKIRSDRKSICKYAFKLYVDLLLEYRKTDNKQSAEN